MQCKDPFSWGRDMAEMIRSAELVKADLVFVSKAMDKKHMAQIIDELKREFPDRTVLYFSDLRGQQLDHV